MPRDTLYIGTHPLPGPILLAPMAGLTDQPFRNLCRDFGAGLAVSEMTIADTALWQTSKSRNRLRLDNENGLRSIQIAGSEPAALAEAARAAVDLGADIIDINMGCPAKKVCRKFAGSALLQDETLVGQILDTVINAVDVPVTLKIRTGTDPEQRNGVSIAKIAEQAGVAALAVHGRTRSCRFTGAVEYETIRAIKQVVSIPVFANGDITNHIEAEQVLLDTGADAVMIGRGALGRPWLFHAINTWIQQKVLPENLSIPKQRDIILSHLDELYRFYGNEKGVRVARKHLTWYCRYLKDADELRYRIVRVESASDQMQLIWEFFHRDQSPLAEKSWSTMETVFSRPGVTNQWRKARKETVDLLTSSTEKAIRRSTAKNIRSNSEIGL
jgi:tRNA-dihydrouridine synthase B